MSNYYSVPFPFDEVIGGKRISKTNLIQSIHDNLRFLILTRIGECAYDKELGFEMWEHDKKVFYHDKTPYYDQEINIVYKGLIENSSAKKDFTQSLKELIQKNEIRLEAIEASFQFKKVGDGKSEGSVYQRHIEITVEGRIKSTGEQLHPRFAMGILYSPFKIESDL